MGYSLGWFVRDWNGKRYLEHGGNIDGFAANVGFLPDNGVGYVLLANVSSTPLQGGVGPLIFEALLTDAYKDSGSKKSDEDFTPLLGKYVADFGPFDDARFTVTEKNGNLAVDVPGQTVFELEPPDKDGKRKFKIAAEIAVSFELDESGKAIALTLYQGGLAFRVPARRRRSQNGSRVRKKWRRFSAITRPASRRSPTSQKSPCSFIAAGWPSMYPGR